MRVALLALVAVEVIHAQNVSTIPHKGIHKVEGTTPVFDLL